MSEAIRAFFAAWGDNDENRRAESLREVLSPNITYLDPRTPEPVTSVEALIAYVAMYTQYAPGATASVSALSETQGHYRATVTFAMADGMTQLGQYFIEVDDQQRLMRMVGFVGLGDPE